MFAFLLLDLFGSIMRSSGRQAAPYLLFFLLSASLSLSARLRDARETLDTEKPRGRTPAERQQTGAVLPHVTKFGCVCSRGLTRCSPVALAGGVDDSMTSLWMDLGRGFFLRLPDRGLMTSSMSSISLSCFLLRYSFLMYSLLALSSSFFCCSSSAFNLKKKTKRQVGKCKL